MGYVGWVAVWISFLHRFVSNSHPIVGTFSTWMNLKFISQIPQKNYFKTHMNWKLRCHGQHFSTYFHDQLPKTHNLQILPHTPKHVSFLQQIEGVDADLSWTWKLFWSLPPFHIQQLTPDGAEEATSDLTERSRQLRWYSFISIKYFYVWLFHRIHF